MSELENKDERAPGTVENRAAKPLGILPKNTQAIVIAVISVIMVAAIAFSGTSAPKAARKPPLPSAPSVTDPNQARIAEYRQRLDEQAKKLATEQGRVPTSPAAIRDERRYAAWSNGTRTNESILRGLCRICPKSS